MFKKYCTETFIGNGLNYNWLPKQLHIDQLKKQVPKSKTGLPLYINAFLSELSLITETFVILLKNQAKNWARSSPDKICRIITEFEIGFHTIQILVRLRVDMKALIALMVKKFEHAFQKNWDDDKWIYKMQVLHTHAKNFGTIHYHLRHPTQFQIPSQQKLCVISSRIMWHNINLMREWSGLPEKVSKCSYGDLPEHMDTFAALCKSIFHFPLTSPFAHFCWAHIKFCAS
jgi:hypothetical protein